MERETLSNKHFSTGRAILSIRLVAFQSTADFRGYLPYWISPNKFKFDFSLDWARA